MTEDRVGVLDTSTLVLIDRLDPEALPQEPVITAVTLAELSVGPLVASSEEERVARHFGFRKPKPPSTRCRSTRKGLERLVGLRPRSAAPAARPLLVPSMR